MSNYFPEVTRLLGKTLQRISLQADFAEIRIMFSSTTSDIHNVDDMTHTYTHRTLTRFEGLIEDLQYGRQCEIGGYIITNSRAHDQYPDHFHADLYETHTGRVSHASISVVLSPYENLLCDKVDFTIESAISNVTRTEVTFTRFTGQ